jgi:hypothetical protein
MRGRACINYTQSITGRVRQAGTFTRAAKQIVRRDHTPVRGGYGLWAGARESGAYRQN